MSFLDVRSWGWRATVLFALGCSLLAMVLVVTASRVSNQPIPGSDTTTEVQLPHAPSSPTERDLCPPDKGWSFSQGVVPPDAPTTHIGARSFYTCRRDGWEVTVWDQGDITCFGPEGAAKSREECGAELVR